MSNYNFERFEKFPEGFKATAYQVLFPQIKGLPLCEEENYFALSNIEEAKAYLNHERFGKNLIEITTKMLRIPSNNPYEAFGEEEVRIFRACMTLFSHVENAPTCFQEMIDKFFEGYYDLKTMNIIWDDEIIENEKKLGRDCKPEEIIRFIFDPSRPVDEQLEEFEKLMEDIIGGKFTGIQKEEFKKKMENMIGVRLNHVREEDE